MSVKRRVSELEGPMLDAAVAKALGHSITFNRDGPLVDGVTAPRPYSTHWNTGGQIIERERIAVLPGSGRLLGYGDSEGPQRSEPPQWRAKMPNQQTYTLGPTPIIAAMRAYVHAKFAPPGMAFADEVEL